eukprot:TRINITY_DN21440_c0_g1_i1.p1 TRINITY_DN21440_c0_g1~~TRINITY_DN21440_c0_g1_i1.p1  ORF type:complete len:110 (-),score=9.36 TRINITY_DN21440_c0_g1_i1:15-344(-)
MIPVRCTTTTTATTTTSTTTTNTTSTFIKSKDTCIDYGLSVEDRKLTCMDTNGKTRSIYEAWRETRACKMCLCQCKCNVLKSKVVHAIRKYVDPQDLIAENFKNNWNKN